MRHDRKTELRVKKGIFGNQNKSGEDTLSEEEARRRGLLDRLRNRIDRYREAGKARREKLELRLRLKSDVSDAPPVAIYDIIPGTARAVLSAADYDELERLIGYTIKHRAYFLQAVTHRSYLQFSQATDLKSNERLEFLGDSILNLVIAEYLYSEFHTLPEGDLTKLRSRLVSGAALVHHAMDIHLERFLLLSTSADSALKRGSATLLADAYEALIAAIYLDGGMDSARDFIYRHIITHGRRDELMLSDKNYKSMLLEFVQSKKIPSPRYVTVHEEGPNHARTFLVEVIVDGTRQGTGSGKSKKEAEQNAAKEALGTFGVLPSEATAIKE